VKTLQNKKRRLKHKQSQPDVVVWDDPEWNPALDALEGSPKGGGYTGRSDPKPLAELLCSGKPVPEQVAWRLGVLLNPPWGTKGPVLTLSIHKRYTGQRELDFIKEMIDLKKKIEEARKGAPKLESAIMDVARKTGKSRSHLLKAWKFTWQKGVPLLAKYSPQKT
jgi:hypothetical protein